MEEINEHHQPQNHTSEMKPKSSNKKKIIGGFLVLVAGIGLFAGGYLTGRNGFKVDAEGPSVNISREIPAEHTDIDFSMFWDIWNTLEDEYFDPEKINTGALVYGAIKGMVAAVGDPYTVFLNPEENRVTQEDLQGNFEGVGIQIGYRGSQLAVIAPLPGTPAAEADIEPGDFIVGIKDEAKDVDRGTVGITLPQAVRLIRGEAGSTVTLTLVREGVDGPIVTDVERRSIDVPSVALEFIGEDENVAHLRVIRFGGETVAEWDDAVLEILKKPDLAGVVVDVRGNPGGFLDAAVDLASDFVETGDTVVIEERGNGERVDFASERIGKLTNADVVVLIDGGSASASEILAGAMRDQAEIPLIGETSFGKGTIQEAQQLGSGTGLHITVARWLTPNEVWVNEGGLVPDTEIEDNPETQEDEVLLEAIRSLVT